MGWGRGALPCSPGQPCTLSTALASVSTSARMAGQRFRIWPLPSQNTRNLLPVGPHSSPLWAGCPSSLRRCEVQVLWPACVSLLVPVVPSCLPHLCRVTQLHPATFTLLSGKGRPSPPSITLLLDAIPRVFRSFQQEGVLADWRRCQKHSKLKRGNNSQTW